ncbi:hypothetical protein RZS08_38260, partial [Arthrospira platensis SPKY1]|nr:hypothetical protein [Arthrospira platensis SPKY1]
MRCHRTGRGALPSDGQAGSPCDRWGPSATRWATRWARRQPGGHIGPRFDRFAVQSLGTVGSPVGRRETSGRGSTDSPREARAYGAIRSGGGDLLERGST